MTMQSLAVKLTALRRSDRSIDRIVVDRTDLTGTFDIALRWSPNFGVDRNQPVQIPEVPPGAPEFLRQALQSISLADGVSFFAAVEEQLGLKLEPRSAPAEVLAIDHIERASPN